jgi:hypothetical protein
MCFSYGCAERRNCKLIIQRAEVPKRRAKISLKNVIASTTFGLKLVPVIEKAPPDRRHRSLPKP